MDQVDILYWKLLGICALIAIIFFFITTDSLVRGKLSLPSWVFSLFTLTIGVFFFRVSLNSLSEFEVGQHDSLDQLVDTWQLIVNIIT